MTLHEQNETVGGRCQSCVISLPGAGPGGTPGVFRFDTGPSLLLFKAKYEEIFGMLGTKLEDFVKVCVTVVVVVVVGMLVEGVEGRRRDLCRGVRAPPLPPTQTMR